MSTIPTVGVVVVETMPKITMAVVTKVKKSWFGLGPTMTYMTCLAGQYQGSQIKVTMEFWDELVAKPSVSVTDIHSNLPK